MKLYQVVDLLSIDSRKLTEYALNPDNPKGKDKALMFQQHLGYNRYNYSILQEQILAKALDADAIFGENDEFGQRYTTDIEIVGIEATQKEIVRIGWIVELESRIAKLVTLYIRKRS
jgi:hypothetical protein